jgi:ADP-ribose pyrophosphatase
MADHGFTVVGNEVIHKGYMVSTEMVTVRTPEGELVERQAIRHPGAVGVVAVHDGHVILVKQYRAPIDDELIEIPAGKLDVAGEELEAAARRELIEEVGLDATTMVLLGEFVTAAGFSDEVLWIFATNDCVEVPRQVDGAEEAHSEVLRVPLADIDDWLASGKLKDAKSLIGLFWARDRGLLRTD